jgi:hypothetical protein
MGQPQQVGSDQRTRQVVAAQGFIYHCPNLSEVLARIIWFGPSCWRAYSTVDGYSALLSIDAHDDDGKEPCYGQGAASKIPTTSSRSHCLATPAASASSILPAAFAFHARTFHEHCSVHSLDGAFSGATTGSILMSRPTSQDSGHSPQGVLRLKWWEQLFGEAGRIMPYAAGNPPKTKAVISRFAI